MQINSTSSQPNTVPIQPDRSANGQDQQQSQVKYTPHSTAPYSQSTKRTSDAFMNTHWNQSKTDNDEETIAVSIAPEGTPPVVPPKDELNNPILESGQKARSIFNRVMNARSKETAYREYSSEIEAMTGKPLTPDQQNKLKKVAGREHLNTPNLAKALKALDIPFEQKVVQPTPEIVSHLNSAERVLVTIESKPPKNYLYTKTASGGWMKEDLKTGSKVASEAPGDFVASRGSSFTLLQVGTGNPNSVHATVLDNNKNTNKNTNTNLALAEALQEQGKKLRQEGKYDEAKESFGRALDEIKGNTPDELLLQCLILRNLAGCALSDDDAIKTCQQEVVTLKSLQANPPKGLTANKVAGHIGHVYHEMAGIYLEQAKQDNPPLDAKTNAEKYLELAVNARENAGEIVRAVPDHLLAMQSLLTLKKARGEQGLEKLELLLEERTGDVKYESGDSTGALEAYTKLCTKLQAANPVDVEHTLDIFKKMETANFLSDSGQFIAIQEARAKFLEKQVDRKDISSDLATSCLAKLATTYDKLAYEWNLENRGQKISDITKITEYLDKAIETRNKAGGSVKDCWDQAQSIEDRLSHFSSGSSSSVSSGSQSDPQQVELQKQLNELLPKLAVDSVPALFAEARTETTNLNLKDTTARATVLQSADKKVDKAMQMAEKVRSSSPMIYIDALRRKADYLEKVKNDTKEADKLRQQAVTIESSINTTST